MAISIPDVLNIDSSGKYKMSIRLYPGGLSFSAYVPSEGSTFLYNEVSFDKTVPYISSLKDFFYAHEFLAWKYKQIYIVVDSLQYTLVPNELFHEKKSARLQDFVFTSPEDKRLSNSSIAFSKLLFGMNNEVYEFCMRSFLNPIFIHSAIPLLEIWKKQSESSEVKQMYVVLKDKRIDTFVFQQGKLLLINTFQIEKLDDVLYYILSVWKQTGLDQKKDQLFLWGDSSYRQKVLELLHVYLQYISQVEIPLEAYLLGVGNTQASIDLIALSVCEL